MQNLSQAMCTLCVLHRIKYAKMHVIGHYGFCQFVFFLWLYSSYSLMQYAKRKEILFFTTLVYHLLDEICDLGVEIQKNIEPLIGHPGKQPQQPAFVFIMLCQLYSSHKVVLYIK